MKTRSMHNILIRSSWCIYKHALENTLGIMQSGSRLPKNKRSISTNDNAEIKLNDEQTTILRDNSSTVYIKKRFREYKYLLDPDIIDRVVHHIRGRVKTEDDTILLCNPGPSCLIEKLLEDEKVRIRVYESNLKLIPNLSRLKERYKDALEVFDYDFLTISKISYCDNKLTESFLDGIKSKDWLSGPPLKLFAVLTPGRHLKFLNFMLNCLCQGGLIYSLGRSEMYLFVTAKEYLVIKEKYGNKWNSRSSSILYSLLCDVEFVDKEPWESFHPKGRKLHSGKNKRNKAYFDADNMHLLKVTPKKDLFETVAAAEKLPELLYFVRHHLYKSNSHVIPSLEKWIPGCGPAFIEKGMPVFRKFKHMSSPEILDVFKTFSNLPEYPYCPFTMAFAKSSSDFINPTAIDNFSDDDNYPEEEE